MRPHDDLIAALDSRIGHCMDLPFQVRGEPPRTATDPLRGSTVFINPSRSQRPRGGDAGCPFCTGQTPPSLFYVEAKDAKGPQDVTSPGVRPAAARVEDEQATCELARGYLDTLAPGQAPDPWTAVRLLLEHSHAGPWGATVPLVHPARPWLMRAFLNFVPVIFDRETLANCFVLSGPPAFHDDDIGVLRKNAGEGGSKRVLALGVVQALMDSWVTLETWSRSRGLIPVPFINGGKSPLSGQSLECFHSQFYALGPKQLPPSFERLARARDRECPVCSIIGDEELRVAEFGSVAVAVHPAPSRNLTLVVAPLEPVPFLADLPSTRDLAAALAWAVRRYEVMLGGVPAYVVAVRTGEQVGHLHAEVVPRSYVNVPGGFEETTGFAVTTREPRQVAVTIRESGASPWEDVA
jgi:galactose-1-phosphate uridylyltransferase